MSATYVPAGNVEVEERVPQMETCLEMILSMQSRKWQARPGAAGVWFAFPEEASAATGSSDEYFTFPEDEPAETTASETLRQLQMMLSMAVSDDMYDSHLKSASRRTYRLASV